MEEPIVRVENLSRLTIKFRGVSILVLNIHYSPQTFCTEQYLLFLAANGLVRSIQDIKFPVLQANSDFLPIIPISITFDINNLTLKRVEWFYPIYPVPIIENVIRREIKIGGAVHTRFRLIISKRIKFITGTVHL